MAPNDKVDEQQKFIDSFLSDVEKSRLQQIADDSVAMLAVQKVILADVYYKGVLRPDIDPAPTRNAALALVITKPDLSNEQLGADLRAQAEGARLVEMGMARLGKFKSPAAPPTGKVNRGR